MILSIPDTYLYPGASRPPVSSRVTSMRKEASGKKDNRPVRASCLKALRKGDVLVIWKLDRLGRNLRHLIETVEDLSKRGVGFKVLHGASIDTTTSQGKLTCTMFGALAEFERDVIRERTIAGLASARARGRLGGRKTVFTASKLRRAAAAMGTVTPTSLISARSSISAGPRSTTTSRQTASLLQGERRCCSGEGMRARTKIEALKLERASVA
jgi:DNA invertase Pin-like site-specific DNA recombinase